MTGDVKVLAIPAKIFFRQAGSLCHVFLQVIRLPRQIAFQSEAPPRFQFPVPHNMEPAFLFVIREDFIPDGQREPPVFPDETGRLFDFVNVIVNFSKNRSNSLSNFKNCSNFEHLSTS